MLSLTIVWHIHPLKIVLALLKYHPQVKAKELSQEWEIKITNPTLILSPEIVLPPLPSTS